MNEVIWPSLSVEPFRWHLEQVDAPDVDLDPLDLTIVRTQHLRVLHTAEDDYITRLMRVSDRTAERTTRRSHLTQRWALVADRFPCGSESLVLPRPPLQEVESITYVDGNGATQTWASSNYDVSIPVGPMAGYARVRPAYGLIWPTTRCVMDAVTVTFRAGYPELATSPVTCDVPEDITHGRLLLIAELYKQRSESLPTLFTPALTRARELWIGYRVYGAGDGA